MKAYMILVPWMWAFICISPEMNTMKWESNAKNDHFIFQLPYYIDGDLKITESAAILHHLARKYGLEADNERDKIKLDMFEGVLREIESKFAVMAYSPGSLVRDEKGKFWKI